MFYLPILLSQHCPQGVVTDGIKVSNVPRFCDNKMECLQTLLYDPKLKLLFGLNFNIIITGYSIVITAFLTNIKLSNKAR